MLHPDRHRDPALKSAADHRFQEINRAFEILGDAKQRAVYDELGVEGLKTQWEVGSRYKTPAEVSYQAAYSSTTFTNIYESLVQMRAEYERLGRKQLEANMESLVKSKVSGHRARVCYVA